MPARKYKTDKGELLARGRELQKSADGRFLHRVEMVCLVIGGIAPSVLARSCRETKAAITRWVKIADEQGFEALRFPKREGRPPRLSIERKAELRRVVAEGEPEKCGVRVWDGPSLSDYIARMWGVAVGRRQCQRLLREMGFELLRPRPFPGKGEVDGPARAGFKKKSGGR